MRRTDSVLVLALATVLCAAAGCSTRAATPGRDTGSGGGDVDTGNSLGFDANFPDLGGSHGPTCSDAAQLIYLVDSDQNLLSYRPDTGAITMIGQLSCAGALVTPFSMAVARDATAYVLHSDHHIYAVSTADASCTSTPWVIDQMGFQQFGMGFVSDDASGTNETLYIAGGAALGIGGGSSTLGTIQIPSWTPTTIGDLTGSPELTGNGLGELWGFFPDTHPMVVRRIDRNDATTVDQYDVSAITGGVSRQASAWAFAYWGGRYYMFYQSLADSSTGIYRLTPDTAVVEPVMLNIGFRVVGAGVSTCAPTILV